MTETEATMGMVGVIIGFLGNLVIMRGYFCSIKECETTRMGCRDERRARLDAADQRWDSIEERLRQIEACMADLKRGWKENYQEVCAIKAIVQRQPPVGRV